MHSYSSAKCQIQGCVSKHQWASLHSACCVMIYQRLGVIKVGLDPRLVYRFSGCGIKCPINLHSSVLQNQQKRVGMWGVGGIGGRKNCACLGITQPKSLSLWLMCIHSVIIRARGWRYPGELRGNVSLIISGSWAATLKKYHFLSSPKWFFSTLGKKQLLMMMITVVLECLPV